MNSCCSCRRMVWAEGTTPVGYNAGVVRLLVVVHPLVALVNEALLLSEGPDHGGAQQRFIEVGVDG